MDQQTKEAARYIAGILANLAVIGYGLALYQKIWWCLIIAIIATKLGFWIIWRINK